MVFDGCLTRVDYTIGAIGMDAQKITVAVLACKNCGAPMHPDPANSAFACPFCGVSLPYSEYTRSGARPLKYKHRRNELQDGLVKLTRVAIMEGLPKKTDLLAFTDPAVRWGHTFADYVRTIDRRAYVTRRDRFTFAFVCTHCGADVECTSTETMYQCMHCGTIYGLDDLANMGLAGAPQIVGNQSMVPSQCLPFSISLPQAQTRIRHLVSLNSELFAGFDVDEMLRTHQLQAVYTPGMICDVALRVQAEYKHKQQDFYLELVDWVLPRDTGIDIDLLDRIGVWDFNEAGPFVPDLVLGDVTICACTNFASKIGMLDSLLAFNAAKQIEARYDAQNVELIRWSRDYVEHQSATIALPVYQLEQLDGQKGGMRILVNGQNGRVVAVVHRGGKDQYCELAAETDGRVDGERTMRSLPVPIQYVKPSHLYAVLPLQAAFGGKAKVLASQDGQGAPSIPSVSVVSGASGKSGGGKKSLFARLFGR